VTANAIQTSVQGLINDAISMAVNAELPLDALRGVALYNPTRDERFTSLASFTTTAQLFATLPHFESRYGNDNRGRLLLQLLYQYFKRIDGVRFDKPTFDGLWDDFLSELAETHWLSRGVANLRHFGTEASQPLQKPLDLGDGITIRSRDPDDLKSLGFGDLIWERIAEDWGTPFTRSSPYVLVSEHRTLKESANLIAGDGYWPWTKAFTALQALRLCATGSVGIGPMWLIRAARFNVGFSGLSQTGFSIPTMGGSAYTWTEEVGLAYSTVYGGLAQLEKEDGYKKAPGNLEVALRVFINGYDRWPSRQDAQLLDAITALEALIGMDAELSFRLAFRVAGLLASDDGERVRLFKLMREFYDTRSKIVHGGTLKPAHQQHLANVEELRSLVRRLLKSFVAFAVNPPNGYSKKFFKEQLDAALLDATERQKVRTAFGLASRQSVHVAPPGAA
jgi:Apea-like HEPN